MTQKKPTPIAYVVPEFPVLRDTFVMNEVLELEARGVPVCIVSLRRPYRPGFHHDLPRLRSPVVYLPDGLGWREVLRKNRRVSGSHRWRYGWGLFRAMWSPRRLWQFLKGGVLADLADRLGIAHIHAQYADEPATVALHASRITRIPWSFNAHGNDIYRNKVNHRALAGKIREARFVSTVCDYNRAFLEKLSDDADGRVFRIYNGIDLERFVPEGSPPGRPFRMVCVSSLVEEKGVPILIKACRRLLDRGVEFHLDIVGDGAQAHHLRTITKGMDLHRHVSLTGPRSHWEVLGYYRRAHAFVLPALVAVDGSREGLPVAMIEALACGLPIVSTQVTGIPEVVQHGVNGLLVPADGPDELAEALEALIRDEDLYRALQANTRSSVVDRFDRRTTAAQLHGLIADRAA